MPLFETPTSPEPTSPEKLRAPLISSPYAALEHHELLQMIDELNDERSRARFREGVWMAFFAHLLFFALLYFVPAWIFHGVKVINPIDAMKAHDKEIYLNMPEVAKTLEKRQNSTSKPKPPAATRALDQQMIQQLQKMQQQADAQRQQQPPAQATPPPPPQQLAANEPKLSLPEAPHPQQQSLPDMPTPQTRSNNSSSMNDPFSREISKAAHEAIANNGSGKTYGSGPSMANKGFGSGMQILTDTQGVNFDPYMSRLKFIIEHAWQPLIPESVYPPLNKQGAVGIRFKIDKSGKLSGITLETPSGDVALDKAAWGAIVTPQPFPPLPKEFPGKNIEIRGGFFYNENPDN